MKNSFLYSVLAYNDKKVTIKELFIFLESLYKIKKVRIFFVFLSLSGFESLKKIKKFQETRGFKFGEQPTIPYQQESVYAKTKNYKNKSVLCIVAKTTQNKYLKIISEINKNRRLFDSINNKFSDYDKIDLITPLNMRKDHDVLQFSFLLSDWAVKAFTLKENMCFSGFPQIFFNCSIVKDVFVLFGREKLFLREINYYYKYLLEYFRFNYLERKSIFKNAKKYLPILNQLLNHRFAFQSNCDYTNLVGSIYNVLKREKALLGHINGKIGEKKKNGMFFHWFNNSSGVSFAQEVATVFLLKEWYEKNVK